MTEPAQPFQVDITINADRDAVWRTMTDPAEIRQWFGWDYDGIDAEIRHIFVEHVRPAPPDRILFEDGSAIELTADGPLTGVRAVLAGPPQGPDPDDLYNGVEEGWRTFFEQLRFLLETRPGGRRRTIYLTGVASGAELLAVGATGGRPWHGSRYQQMTVSDAGHLVAVASQALLTSENVNPAAITISTYGLDDAGFAAVEEHWTKRWSAVSAARVTTEAGESMVHPPGH
ncbi:MAG TPA: SRPBCC domain-containing protein [Catenuloplanes sp.]